jgi:hypothetical protein
MNPVPPILSLIEVLLIIAPIIVVAVALAWCVHAAFPSSVAHGQQAPGAPVGDLSTPMTNVTLAELVVSALLGVVVGVIVSVLGGFSVLMRGESSEGLLGSLVAAIAVALGAGASILNTAALGTRSPLPAISFLLLFVISGLYWGFLRANLAG